MYKGFIWVYTDEYCIYILSFDLEKYEEGSGFPDIFPEAGSGVLSVDTITESPQVFLKPTYTESEVQGEVITHKPSVTTSVSPSYAITDDTLLPLLPPPSSTDLESEFSNVTEALMSDTGKLSIKYGEIDL